MELGNKAINAEAVDIETFTVKVWFDNGKTATISLSEYFDPPKGLAKDIIVGGLFDKCYATPHGTLAWPNGIEFCPDLLLAKFKEQQGSAA